MKPLVTHELTEGKAVGAQRGFAATFNWMLRFVTNLAGGPGVTVDRANGDHPVIRVAGAAASATTDYWEVKWDATAERYIVRITEDAYTLAGVSVPMTQADDEWYAILGTAPATGETADVYLRFKPRVSVDDGDIGPAFVVAFGDAAAQGDSWTARIATVSVAEDDDGNVTRTISHVYREKVDFLTVPTPGLVEPYWTVAAANPEVYTMHTPATSNAPVCGGDLADATIATTTDEATVYYQIDCTGSSCAPSVTATASTADGILQTPIFTVKGGAVKSDLRDNLSNLVFYP